MENEHCNSVELKPGMNYIEIDMPELAIRILEAITYTERVEPDAKKCLDSLSAEARYGLVAAAEAAADFIMGAIASATRAN